MKVLQVIDSLPATSGGSRFVVNLAKSLSARDNDVQVLVIDGKQSHFMSELSSAGINVIALDENCRTRYKFKYVRQIANIISDFDIVHVHIFPTSYIVAFATFLSSKKNHLVFTEHSSYNRRANHWAFKYIEKLVYSRYEKIVCLSDQIYTFVRKLLNTPQEKLRIIQNAIDSEAVKQALPYTKIELGFKESDFLLLMSARLSYPKNHKVLFQAMEFLGKNVKLLIAGDGELKDELKIRVEELNLNERIYFLGSRTDVFRLMKSVDVNILVSNFEGLSLAALEAMSAGKPFIASNVEGLDFVVRKERMLFQNTAESISQAVNELIENPEWYKEATDISTNRAAMFDIRKMTDQYMDVYNEVYKATSHDNYVIH